MTNMVFADFHIHSKYSRACSKNLTLPEIARACERKGIDLVATSDFTHPAWFAHIEEELEEVTPGIFQLTGARSKTKFILVTEISSIYSQGGKVRRVHSLVFSPSIACAKKYIEELKREGCNLKSDGRPIVGLSAKQLLKIAHNISPEMELVPAHAWTPWFSVFGSKSGFDSLEECFEELTLLIHAIETGLSSDPPMNFLVSKLDGITLLSNSDAHSLEKLGREATVFNVQENFSYQDIISAIRNKKSGGILETIEFYPQEGKYHIDGHAACKFFCEPNETKKLHGRCPICGRELTVGVLSRVTELADRKIKKVIHTNHISYRHIIPLLDLIAYAKQASAASKKVKILYESMLESYGSEFTILLEISPREIAKLDSDVARVIASMRSNNIKLSSGYDGIFGKIIR